MNCFLCLNRNQNSVLINHAVEIPNSAAHRIKCNLVLTSTSKFLKDLQVFIEPKLLEKSCCYLLIIYMEKALQKVKTDEILNVLAFVICTCVITLHLFSANQKHIIFFMYTINQYGPNELMSLNIQKKKVKETMPGISLLYQL